MAKSASSSPIEKFRFQLTIFTNNKNNGGFSISSLNSLIATTNDTKIYTRAGFSEIDAPKVSTKEILYRENTYGNQPIKVPGLATFDPVVLKRGSTLSRDLYNWYKLVNDMTVATSKFQQTLAGLSAVPFQEPNFMREVLISSLDRAGNFNKHWLLFNAWPSSYQGADGFNAASSEILMESMTLTYELFIECKGNSITAALNDAKQQADHAAALAAEAALVAGASGLLGLL